MPKPKLDVVMWSPKVLIRPSLQPNIGVKEPIHVTEPKPFIGTVRIPLSITELVVGLNATIGTEVLKPFGQLEAPMREIPMERKRDTQKSGNDVKPKRRPKSAPTERERRKQTEHMHDR
nr:hypothetical protein Iba_chr09aCG7920 [Ipomoea batatas]